jgi:hypothetical protein
MPTMSCTEFSHRLDEAIERRESLDTVWLREHATGCAECRPLWLDALAVDQAIARWKKPVPVAGLTDRILAQVTADAAAVTADASVGIEQGLAKPVADEIAPQPRRRVNRTAGAVITALALCVCAVLFLSRPRPQPPVARPEVARSAEPVVTASREQKLQPASPVAALAVRPAPIASAPVEVMVADAGSAYLHLAGDAAKAVTAASVLVPSADPADEVPAAPKDEEPWVDGMRREIAPVTHQLSHAFEFLIHAVPEKRAPAT